MASSGNEKLQSLDHNIKRGLNSYDSLRNDVVNGHRSAERVVNNLERLNSGLKKNGVNIGL